MHTSIIPYLSYLLYNIYYHLFYVCCETRQTLESCRSSRSVICGPLRGLWEVSGLCQETGRKVEEALARLQLREEETGQAELFTMSM